MSGKIKLYLSVLLIVCCTLLLSSCTSKEEKERMEEEAALDSVSSSIEGTVTAFTGSEISIVTSDKKELTFNMTKAELTCKNGIIPGNKVTLVYVGALKDTDTSKVRLRKISTDDDNSGLLPEPGTTLVSPKNTDEEFLAGTAGYEEPASGAEVDAKTEITTAISGVNVRADAASQSTIIGSLKAGEEVTRTGICDNGWHRIIYEDQTGFVWGEYLK